VKGVDETVGEIARALEDLLRGLDKLRSELDSNLLSRLRRRSRRDSWPNCRIPPLNGLDNPEDYEQEDFNGLDVQDNVLAKKRPIENLPVHDEQTAEKEHGPSDNAVRPRVPLVLRRVRALDSEHAIDDGGQGKESEHCECR
jgi:hypothetical protein